VSELVGLADVEAAARRIAGRVRLTPTIEADLVRTPVWREPADGARLLLKLENLQVSGSFKARSASNKLATLDAAAVARGVCTASGGNHGLAVAYTAWQAGTLAVVFVPETTAAEKIERLRAWDAEVVVTGAVWDEAQAAALAAARERKLTYVHPFADPAIIAGQGTVALELLRQAPATDTLVVAIGGGGLISGVALAAKALRPGIRIVGVEPVGAPTLYESLKAHQLVTLPAIDTAAGTLAPRRSMPINYDLIAAHVDRIVLVHDEGMRAAAQWLWFEFGIAAELAGAAAVAALKTGRHRPEPDETVVALVCGAGRDGIA